MNDKNGLAGERHPGGAGATGSAEGSAEPLLHTARTPDAGKFTRGICRRKRIINVLSVNVLSAKADYQSIISLNRKGYFGLLVYGVDTYSSR